MAKLAFVFPGQGSQKPGMGKELADNFIEAKEIFEKANQALGFDITKLCFEGPVEELRKTEITQPAILTVSSAIFAILKAKGKKPQAVAGHSLGEYSALYAAGALKFEDVVKLVNLRGKFMQEAVPIGEGAMAAILGLKPDQINNVCQEASFAGVVEAANFNSPGQVVISGKKAAVDEAMKIAKTKGAKRAIPLQVSAPFHSSLMQPAADSLAKELNKINFSDATIPVYSNVTAKEIKSAETIQELLIKQVVSSVLWENLINNMINDGIDTFVEVGPGKVLSGLIGKINNSVKIFNVEDQKSLEGVLSL